MKVGDNMKDKETNKTGYTVDNITDNTTDNKTDSTGYKTGFLLTISTLIIISATILISTFIPPSNKQIVENYKPVMQKELSSSSLPARHTLSTPLVKTSSTLRAISTLPVMTTSLVGNNVKLPLTHNRLAMVVPLKFKQVMFQQTLTKQAGIGEWWNNLWKKKDKPKKNPIQRALDFLLSPFKSLFRFIKKIIMLILIVILLVKGLPILLRRRRLKKYDNVPSNNYNNNNNNSNNNGNNMW